MISQVSKLCSIAFCCPRYMQLGKQKEILLCSKIEKREENSQQFSVLLERFPEFPLKLDKIKTRISNLTKLFANS